MLELNDIVIVWQNSAAYGAPGVITGYPIGFSTGNYKVRIGDDVYVVPDTELEKLYRLDKGEYIVKLDEEDEGNNEGDGSDEPDSGGDPGEGPGAGLDAA